MLMRVSGGETRRVTTAVIIGGLMWRRGERRDWAVCWKQLCGRIGVSAAAERLEGVTDDYDVGWTGHDGDGAEMKELFLGMLRWKKKG